MARLTTTLFIAAALVATAGCSKKHPAELPPAPGGPPPAPAEAPRDSVAPGSRADFERSVTSNTIHFALDKYDVDDASRAILDSQAAWLAKYPNVTVSLEGHCDERGTREYNLALGERRANAVKNVLVALGIPAQRVSTISYGKERPAVVGSTEAAYAQNRRGVTTVN
jgi:peptidoglycan-associated lipoprotein